MKNAKSVVLPRRDFYSGKKILVTGHSGFKGGWLVVWLKALGADVTGVSLAPVGNPNLFDGARVEEGIDSCICDIRRQEDLNRIVARLKPDVVFHLAAQALVRTSYDRPVDTFLTNVMGTVHVLDALRSLGRRSIAIIVTTDKVYQNKEWPYPYREHDPLGGHDPYSASKAAAEIATAAYRDAFLRQAGVSVATGRAGNVIGGGDWSVDRLLPDAVRAWSRGDRLFVRRPNALRPWQHVLDALAGYLVLAERLWADDALSVAWNFGPATNEAASVREVIEQARVAFGAGDVEWGLGTDGPHEAGLLTLETAKARQVLGITPRWNLTESIDRTMSWYRQAAEGANQRELCRADIAEYEAQE